MDYRLKIGDKVLCKKSIPSKISKSGDYIEKGKYYTLLKINNLWVNIQLNDERNFFTFSLSPYSSASPNQLWDHFYTPRELRKLKLDNLK